MWHVRSEAGISSRDARVRCCSGAAGAAGAEAAWVKDELRLNVRTGPGVQYRIVGALQTGDAVQIVSRGEGWTEVRPETMRRAGYRRGTCSHATARVALAEREVESAELEKRCGAHRIRVPAAHRPRGDQRAGREQQAEITRLTRENLELRAGARWPEWITGAASSSSGWSSAPSSPAAPGAGGSNASSSSLDPGPGEPGPPAVARRASLRAPVGACLRLRLAG